MRPNNSGRITQTQALALLSYDQKTGLLRWRKRVAANVFAGSVAGTVGTGGYRFVVINGRRYGASRLIWLMQTGEWPKHQIDHRNLNNADDCWANLREATHNQNQSNKNRPTNNTSGHRGVVQHRGGWMARIGHNNDYLYLGFFGKKEDAIAARKLAELQYFGEYTPI